jgi:hypothetical protein
MTTPTKVFPADWAIRKAIKDSETDTARFGWTVESVKKQWASAATSPPRVIIVLAEYIEKYEQPPVDPDLLLARQCAADNSKSENAKAAYLAGTYDGHCDCRTQVYISMTAIKAYKKAHDIKEDFSDDYRHPLEGKVGDG